MKIKKFPGYLTDVSAKEEPLITSGGIGWGPARMLRHARDTQSEVLCGLAPHLVGVLRVVAVQAASRRLCLSAIAMPIAKKTPSFPRMLVAWILGIRHIFSRVSYRPTYEPAGHYLTKIAYSRFSNYPVHVRACMEVMFLASERYCACAFSDIGR